MALFDGMDDLYYLVVHRGRTSNLAAIVRHCAVDRIHLCKLAFLQVLQHAGLEEGMLAYGDRYDEE